MATLSDCLHTTVRKTEMANTVLSLSSSSSKMETNKDQNGVIQPLLTGNIIYSRYVQRRGQSGGALVTGGSGPDTGRLGARDNPTYRAPM